jgi:hypothetical protein
VEDYAVDQGVDTSEQPASDVEEKEERQSDGDGDGEENLDFSESQQKKKTRKKKSKSSNKKTTTKPSTTVTFNLASGDTFDEHWTSQRRAKFDGMLKYWLDEKSDTKGEQLQIYIDLGSEATKLAALQHDM